MLASYGKWISAWCIIDDDKTGDDALISSVVNKGTNVLH